MFKCTKCDFYNSNNVSGIFTKHLKTHGLSMRDYVVKTEYGGVAPPCACGYCDELPTFNRGKFSSYAADHKEFPVRERLYIKRYGVPLCEECGKDAGFRRGVPKRYCSFVCFGKNNGFSLPSTQETIRQSVQEKYGVANVSHLPHVKSKISKANTGHDSHSTEEGRRKTSETFKRKWQDPSYRAHTIQKATAACNTIEEKQRRSEAQRIRWQNSEYVALMLDRAVVNKNSGLHRKIRSRLNLETLGFVSEQKVGRYLVDELHEGKKVVVEVNGDYVHANPRFYEANQVIVMPGNSYTAAKKWESDARRKQKLESLGYKVLVVWGSDDLAAKKVELEAL